MKRALLLSTLLALALFALLFLRGAPGPAAQLARQTDRTPPLARAEDAPLERSEAAPEEARTTLESPAPAQRAELAADEAPDVAGPPLARVRLDVRYAATAQPVQGAQVFLDAGAARGATDAHGQLELRLPLGSRLAVLRVRPGEDASVFVPYERNLDRELGAAGCELQVLVDRGVDLRGVVRDDATGRAIPAVHVRIGGLGFRDDVHSREDGSFDLLGLLADRYGASHRLVADHPEYQPLTTSIELEDPPSVPQPIVLVLQPGLELSGQVLDESGRPVAGALVSLHAPLGSGARTDEFGRFRFGALGTLEEVTLRVAAQHEGALAIRAAQLDLGALTESRTDLVIRVQRAVVVHVFAERADGRALSANEFVALGAGAMPAAHFGGLHAGAAPPWREFLAPRGTEVEIEVWSSPGQPGARPRSCLRGRARVRTDSGSDAPLEAHVTLSESVDLELPPALVDTVAADLAPASPIRCVLDLTLLDAQSGRPLGLEDRIEVRCGQELAKLEPNTKGLSRLWLHPGTSSLDARVAGGRWKSFELAIPPSGYAKAEWRLEARR
ncbi:MAG: carboxypeptidase regulatory-like domain-containing protein [Planctomycetes bacterium]|nr:carboxypeptidase regulatory-like domain-containing protein [Planctomycetota bacterium]